MIARFEMIAGVVCVVCIGLLLLSPSEREDFPPVRFLLRLMFPKLDFVKRHRAVSVAAGVLLAIFGLGAGLAFYITRWGNR